MFNTTLMTLIFGALVALGGIMGFAKSGSLPSLWAGVISGLALIAASFGIKKRKPWGYPLALILGCLLLALFILRFIKTHAFFPAGGMALLSLVFVLSVAIRKR